MHEASGLCLPGMEANTSRTFTFQCRMLSASRVSRHLMQWAQSLSSASLFYIWKTESQKLNNLLKFRELVSAIFQTRKLSSVGLSDLSPCKWPTPYVFELHAHSFWEINQQFSILWVHLDLCVFIWVGSTYLPGPSKRTPEFKQGRGNA